MNLISDKHGRPIKGNGLSEFMVRAAAVAALPRECTAHGWRKALQRLLAEHGASNKELQSMSGHAALKETEVLHQGAD
jgi:site-specific recombinase XerD